MKLLGLTNPYKEKFHWLHMKQVIEQLRDLSNIDLDYHFESETNTKRPENANETYSLYESALSDYKLGKQEFAKLTLQGLSQKFDLAKFAYAIIKLNSNSTQDYNEAVALLEQTASRTISKGDAKPNNISSLYVLGIIYGNKLGWQTLHSKNAIQLLKEFTTAVEGKLKSENTKSKRIRQELTEANYQIGRLLYIERDAGYRRYLNRASEDGHIQAHYLLGITSTSLDEAQYYFFKIINQSNFNVNVKELLAEIRCQLSKWHEKKTNKLSKDILEYYKRTAGNDSHIKSQFKLGIIYVKDNDIKKDDLLAWKHLYKVVSRTYYETKNVNECRLVIYEY